MLSFADEEVYFVSNSVVVAKWVVWKQVGEAWRIHDGGSVAEPSGRTEIARCPG